MEKFQELREVAKKKLQLADHILTMTYPIVNDSKLLLAVVENMFLALTNAMGSVLYYEFPHFMITSQANSIYSKSM
jgi:hypothetical protein